MSFESISITRQYPIIAGFVRIANDQLKDQQRVTLAQALAAAPGSTVANTSTGGARAAGGRHGVQQWLEVCWNAAPANSTAKVPSMAISLADPITGGGYASCAGNAELTALVS